MSLTEFLLVQTRPNLVFNGPGGKKGEAVAATPVRVASSQLVTWDEEPDALLRSTLFPQPVADAAEMPRSVRLQALIRAAAGLQRHEATHAFNAHRAFPSAQAKYPAELFVGVGDTTWHYDSSWDGLRPVGATADDLPWDALDDGAPAFLAVLGRPNRLPAYYRELQWALTLCEEGHLGALAAQLARVLGFGTEVLTEFDDQGLVERLGAVPGDVWLPGAVIGLDGARPEFPAGAAEWPVPTESWLDADRQAWVRRSGVEAETAAATAGTGAAAAGLAEPPAAASAGAATERAADMMSAPGSASSAQSGVSPSRPWSSVLFDRSGGRSPGGLTASPEKLPPGVLSAALSAASDAATDWLPDPAAVEIHAVVQRTSDLDDGIYAWDPVARQLVLREAGPRLAAVQQAFYYPRTVTRVDTCNVALCVAVDYDAALESEGPRGLRLAQLRFGALMQASAMVCSAHDVFLRPCRSFDPDALGTLLGLRPGLTVGYLSLVGRSRYTDLMLDLRPAVAPQ